MIKPTREEIRSIAVREKSVQMLIDRCGVGQAEANQIVTQLLTGFVPQGYKRFVGGKYERLEITGVFGFSARGVPVWECTCDCGAKMNMPHDRWRREVYKSCGCYQKEAVASLLRTHGLSHTRAYSIWRGVIARCENIEDANYQKYGGRGITVCDAWRESFENFVGDMGLPPSCKHSIDRIDNNGHYEPENCRWATARQQSRNRRSNRLLTFNGETKCIAEWSESTGLSRTCIEMRLNKKLPIEEVLSPAGRKRRIADRMSDVLEMREEGKSISEIAREVGFTPDTVSLALRGTTKKIIAELRQKKLA